MLQNKILRTSFLSLFVVGILVSGCVAETSDAEQVASKESNLYPLSPNLWLAQRNTNRVTLSVCYDTTGLTGPEPGWVQDAVTNTWDTVSWVDFRWRIGCVGGEQIHIVVEDIKDANGKPVGPHTEGLGTAFGRVHFDFTFNNGWSPACKASAAARENCIRTIAVHEFGHVLGFAHDQNRPDFAACGDGSNPADQGANGDLPLFTPDPNSIMSYCPEGQNLGLLSADDQDQVQRMYGGEGVPVNTTDYYAIRRQDNGTYIKMIPAIGIIPGAPSWVPEIQEANRTRHLVRLRRAAAGNLSYGDSVSLRDSATNLYYCARVAGVPDRPLVVIEGKTSECFWTIDHTSGTVGGVSVNVNDPIKLRWPLLLNGQTLFFGSGTGSGSELRVLGSIPRTP